jgi:hypothetical protein
MSSSLNYKNQTKMMFSKDDISPIVYLNDKPIYLQGGSEDLLT